jgi:hypothetical protein
MHGPGGKRQLRGRDTTCNEHRHGRGSDPEPPAQGIPPDILVTCFIARLIAHKLTRGIAIIAGHGNDPDMLTIPPIASSFGALQDGRDHIAGQDPREAKGEFDGADRGTEVVPDIA